MPKLRRLLWVPVGAVYRRPRLAALLLVGWAIALVPVWRAPLLPLPALPDHLQHIAVWHRLGDASYRYRDFYSPAHALLPPFAYYLPVHLLAWLVPVETANKLFLSLYALALPLSFIALADRYRRSAWLFLFTLPLVWNFAFAAGDIPFCAALPPLFFALALLDAHLDAPCPSTGQLAVFLALALLVFLFHPLAFALLVAVSLLVLLSHARRPAHALFAGAVLAAAVALALLDVVVFSPGGLADLRVALQGAREPLIDCLREVFHRVVASWPEQKDELSLVLLAVPWILLSTTARGAHPDELRRLRGFIPELAFALCLLGYLAIPRQADLARDAGTRLLPTAALFGALLVRGPIEGGRRALLLPVAFVAVAFPLWLSRQYLDFNGRNDGLAKVMAMVPRGSSTLLVQFGDATDPAIDPQFAVYSQFHCYPSLIAGGEDPFQSEWRFPFKVIPSARHRAPATPMAFEPARDAPRWDFILTHFEPADGALLAHSGIAPRPIARAGTFRLYRGREVH